MEEAAEAERANPTKKYLEIPELNAPFKSLLAALLTDAATLKFGYQALIEGEKRDGMSGKLNEFNQRHRIWLAECDRFVGALKETSAPTIVLEAVVPALDQIADRIASSKTRHRGMIITTIVAGIACHPIAQAQVWKPGSAAHRDGGD